MNASQLVEAMETGQLVDFLEGVNRWSGPWVVFDVALRPASPARARLVAPEGPGLRDHCEANRVRPHDAGDVGDVVR